MVRFRGAYLDGRFKKPAGKPAYRAKFDPGNTDCLVGEWSPTLEEVGPAVEAAERAFPSWAGLAPKGRYGFLKNLKKVYRRNRRGLAETISMEMGKTLEESTAEVEASIAKVDLTLREGLELIRDTRRRDPKRYYRFMPRGPLVVLGPFNFPLHLPNGNFIAALATGNTVVFKPSELTPFTGQKIVECFHEAGFPKGVFNLVQGGGEVGSRLVTHEKIRGVLFVGSDSTGHKISQAIQGSPGKICVLEMGGKNGAIVFPDADLEEALEACLASALATTGQRCTSLSRLILHRSLAREFIPRFVEAMAAWPVGHYRDPQAKMGPLVDEGGQKKFLRYQKMARVDGAEVLLAGGKLKLKTTGFYVNPSVHRITSAKPRKKKTGYRYDEIFGPDVAIYTFDKVEEAVRIHNDCRYGLIGSVFTRSKKRFRDLIPRLEVGNLFLNRPTIGASGKLPFGGIKASGNHFPAGLFSPYYCTYPLAIQE